ncbi:MULTISPECIES: DUF2169 family type VI secretion system accessory protein [unclassified Pseudomonas]|uniref:DUF2169 family type VI secretion system accessory protein n=1 Tax=unclassified Pseudomonas TaxID=196821 RepID=UPI002E821F15|nr:DUF2169 domain-containing protein [Pseudomonas sp. 10C3]MEE3507417.1 DUF2169 domain-containing protein [Pseudomonas sp. 10C3]
MNYKLDEHCLLLTARYQALKVPYLVATVCILIDASGNPLSTEACVEWINSRFSGKPFDHGLKKSVGTFAVHGLAFSLNEKQRDGMAVRVRIGSCDKTLHVFPSRVWRRELTGWSGVATARLDAVALDFEHAFGGAGFSDNPDGVGYVDEPDRIAGSALAQIEYPLPGLRSPLERLPLASFLPLPPQCSERRSFIGTVDERWQADGAPWLPADTDVRWFNEVAEDQCHNQYWRGDEAWSVIGMHARFPELTGTLPGLRPRLFVEHADSALNITEVLLDLDTVWLFPNEEYQLLLYRAQLPLHETDAQDIAALGVGCERRNDPILSKEEWVDKLWPQAEVEPLQAAMVSLPVDDEVILSALEADANIIYAEVANMHQQGIESAKKIASRLGHPFDPSQYPPPARPGFAAAIRRGEIAPVPIFDAVALEADLRASVAAELERAHLYVEQIAKRMNRSAESIYGQAASADSTAAGQQFNAFSMVSRLPLSTAKKAEYQAKIEEGLTQAKSVEAEITRAIAEMTSQLTGGTEYLPEVLSTLPAVSWTRELLEAAHSASQSLIGQRFLDIDLSGVDMSGAVLSGVYFERCQLKDAKLNGAAMNDGVFIDCDLTRVNMCEAHLKGAFFQHCNIDDAKFSGARISELYATGCSLLRTQFTAAILPQAQFVDCALDNADFTRAGLAGASFHTCTLTAVSAVEADLSKSSLHACAVDCLQVSGADLEQASWSQVTGTAVDAKAVKAANFRLDQSCQLSGICLDAAQLQRASFQGVNLRGASLKGTTLKKALISRCDLRDSDGYHLNAVQADFTGSDLRQVRWQGANLMEARLRKVQLDAADLTGSNLFGVVTEAVRGKDVVLDRVLLGRCRLKEDLAHV